MHRSQVPLFGMRTNGTAIYTPRPDETIKNSTLKLEFHISNAKPTGRRCTVKVYASYLSESVGHLLPLKTQNEFIGTYTLDHRFQERFNRFP